MYVTKELDQGSHSHMKSNKYVYFRVNNCSYLLTGLDMANGVAIPNAFIRCCIVGVADDDDVTFPPPKRCC